MVENPPAGYQRMIPYLLYEDAPAALEFLGRAFGFEERFRFQNQEGQVGHAEVAYKDNVVMLATASREMQHDSPKNLPARHGLVMVYVDDVDAHYARAKAAGAEITRELADQFYGDRTYGAKDPEGHAWYFATHVKDVPPEEMQAAEEAQASKDAGPGQAGPA